jgi:hypothetical protein
MSDQVPSGPMEEFGEQFRDLSAYLQAAHEEERRSVARYRYFPELDKPPRVLYIYN